MIQSLLQKAWKFISKSLPDLDVGNVMNKAMDIGRSQTTPKAVMSMLENFARSKGYNQVFDGNKVWNSLKSKSVEEVIPYTQKTLKEMGKLDILTNFLFKKV